MQICTLEQFQPVISAILRFALSSTSYRQLPPMGDCGIINGLGLNHLRKHK
ncbi:hypothetical protein HH620_003324 [Escherichia coli]|nr:hypothetical protein [Escherichia coli]EFI3764952.1 hypothetical protein [Escherichia coli]EFI3801221.1 hypothetical protein [Escherichia coli]EFI9697763.1 hypothetical protein [Escherichia coli]EFJ0081240.1 hypothetical protein [Escherichia coli]